MPVRAFLSTISPVIAREPSVFVDALANTCNVEEASGALSSGRPIVVLKPKVSYLHTVIVHLVWCTSQHILSTCIDTTYQDHSGGTDCGMSLSLMIIACILTRQAASLNTHVGQAWLFEACVSHSKDHTTSKLAAQCTEPL